ncbi:MAG: redoxin domain-containing protein, partial [Planctomycetaceae bacterium]
PDEPGAQATFDQKFRLGFPLLSDPDHAVAQAWGVWGEKTRYGKTYMGIIRASFLVGPDGKILAPFYNVKPEDTVPLAQKALADR